LNVQETDWNSHSTAICARAYCLWGWGHYEKVGKV
jgi:hypothetical protein